MGLPGMPGNLVSNDGDLMRMIQDLQAQINELRAANPLATMGIVPKMDGIVIEGSETVNGPLTINGPLTLQPGSIQNDSLANPFKTQTVFNYVSNYTITTTSTIRASVALTVPAGFTQAVVIANPTAMGYNNTASTDYLYALAAIQGVSGGELYSAAPAGYGTGLAAPFHATLTGLTGGQTITVGVATRTGFNAWAASASNQANIYATAMYLR